MRKSFIFQGVADGDFCHKECPFLVETIEGVPDHVRKAYPGARNYRCLIFGEITESKQDGMFCITNRPRRTERCKLMGDVEEDSE